RGEVGEGAADRLGRVVEAVRQPVRGGAVVGQAHARVGEAAQCAALEDLPQREGVAVGEAGQGDGDDDAGLVGRGEELLALGDGGGEQLLGEDVLAGGDDLAEHLAVHGGGGGDGDAVEVLAREQRVEVGDELGAEGL